MKVPLPILHLSDLNFGPRGLCLSVALGVCSLAGSAAAQAPVATDEASPAQPPATQARPPSAPPDTHQPLLTPGGTYLPPAPLRERPVEPRRLPKELPYQDGYPIPDGYHVESRMRRVPLVLGGVLFGVAYLGAASGGTQGHPELFVPVVGPFIAAAQIERGSGEWAATGQAIAIVFTATSGLLQAGGLGLFFYGLGSRQPVLVRNDAGARSIRVAPAWIGSQGWGLGVTGRL